MKWSQFIIKSENNQDNEIILFNTLSKGIISFDKQTLDVVNQVIKSGNTVGDSKLQGYLKLLKEEEFILEDNIKEKEFFINSLVHEWNNHNVLAIDLLPTTGCNFSCSYCYQDGIERKHNLNSNELKLIDAYTRSYLNQNPHIRYLTITLHGGEPTFNWTIVPEALDMFWDISKDLSINMNTSIVSNTYLLTPEKSDLLRKYNWTRLQTTIDGPKNIHNERRKLINGGETYDKIMNNLKYIIDNNILNSIDLRINYDKSNYDEIPKLIDILAEEFIPKQLYLSFGLITQTFNSDAHDYIYDKKINDNDFFNAYINLYEYAHSKGFPLPDSYVFGSICTGKMKHSLIFSPDHNLYKCLSMVGREDGIVGSWIEDKCLSPSKHYFNLDYYDDCFNKECSLIPICHADCRFDALINKNDFYSVDCRKYILEKVNKELLKIKYA